MGFVPSIRSFVSYRDDSLRGKPYVRGEPKVFLFVFYSFFTSLLRRTTVQVIFASFAGIRAGPKVVELSLFMH